MASDFDFSGFSLWDQPSFDFDFSGFDFGFPSFNFPSFDFSGFNFDLPQLPSFDFGGMPAFDFNFGAMPEFGGFGFGGFSDPLALPTLHDFTLMPDGGRMPGFEQFGIPSPEMQSFAPPMTLGALGYGGSAAPSLGLPEPGMAQGSDSLVNLQGQYPGLPVEEFLGTQEGLPGGAGYQLPGDLSLTGGEGDGSFQMPAAFGGALSQAGPPSMLESLAAMQRLSGAGRPEGTASTIAKLAAAFGPTAIQGLGLGLQAMNRPQRNPLEDELIKARIASSGLQDSLAKDRLAFEKENAEAMREAQMEMQNAMLAARAPGGPQNAQALLASNPQLAALYNALSQSATGLAGGKLSPQFQAVIDQVAGVEIAELQKQAQQQKAQAMEMATRQGVNPANILAEIEQRLLQEIARARANARTTLLQMLQPGMNLFNMAGSLFGNLSQAPAFPG